MSTLSGLIRRSPSGQSVVLPNEMVSGLKIKLLLKEEIFSIELSRTSLSLRLNCSLVSCDHVGGCHMTAVPGKSLESFSRISEVVFSGQHCHVFGRDVRFVDLVISFSG